MVLFLQSIYFSLALTQNKTGGATYALPFFVIIREDDREGILVLLDLQSGETRGPW